MIIVPEGLRGPMAGRRPRLLERERRSSSPSEVLVEVRSDSADLRTDAVLVDGSASEGTALAEVAEMEAVASVEAMMGCWVWRDSVERLYSR